MSQQSEWTSCEHEYHRKTSAFSVKRLWFAGVWFMFSALFTCRCVMEPWTASSRSTATLENEWGWTWERKVCRSHGEFRSHSVWRQLLLLFIKRLGEAVIWTKHLTYESINWWRDGSLMKACASFSSTLKHILKWWSQWSLRCCYVVIISVCSNNITQQASHTLALRIYTVYFWMQSLWTTCYFGLFNCSPLWGAGSLCFRGAAAAGCLDSACMWC